MGWVEDGGRSWAKDKGGSGNPKRLMKRETLNAVRRNAINQHWF
ncbi:MULTISPECIES: hypothetical protein [Chryseobacterium]|nr:MULTISPECIES: hypothetical protein [Chryseobacterium]